MSTLHVRTSTYDVDVWDAGNGDYVYEVFLKVAGGLRHVVNRVLQRTTRSRKTSRRTCSNDRHLGMATGGHGTSRSVNVSRWLSWIFGSGRDQAEEWDAQRWRLERDKRFDSLLVDQESPAEDLPPDITDAGIDQIDFLSTARFISKEASPFRPRTLSG